MKRKPIYIQQLFDQSISKVGQHCALPANHKEINLEVVGVINTVDTIKIEEMKKIIQLGVELIQVNGDPNLIFNKTDDLGNIPTDLTNASKSYIGSEKIAYESAYHANMARASVLETYVNELNNTVIAMKQTAALQKSKADELRRKEEENERMLNGLS